MKCAFSPAIALAIAFCATASASDTFPSKPITLVVPFAPGGNLDVVARTIAPSLGQVLGQSVIVDNRAGAGGAIGASQVARAQADGYTLLVSTPNALVALPLMTKTTYKLDNFTPVGIVSSTPLVLVSNAKGQYQNIQEVLAAVRAKPGQISAGHAGPGTTNHVALLQLEDEGKLSFNTIAYKGSGPALQDLLGGQVDVVVDQLTSSSSHIQQGSLKALAVLSKDRDATLPHVPTLAESGIKDFNASTTTGLLAPKGTPVEVVKKLNDALRKTLEEPKVKERLSAIGSPAKPSSQEEWLALLKREAVSAQRLSATGKLKAD